MDTVGSAGEERLTLYRAACPEREAAPPAACGEANDPGLWNAEVRATFSAGEEITLHLEGYPGEDWRLNIRAAE